MTPEQQQALQEHIQAMPATGYAYAKILYEVNPLKKLTTLAGIEQAVRSQMQRHVMPKVGVFLSKQLQAQQQDTAAPSKAYWENYP